MSAPNRLIDEGASDFERQLLGAALTERPTREARSLLLASLGIAGVTTTATTAAGGTGAAGALSTATKAWGLKSFCIVALATAAGAAALRAVGPSTSERQPAAVSAAGAVLAPHPVGATTVSMVPTSPLPMVRPPAHSMLEPAASATRSQSPHVAQSVVTTPRATASEEASPQPHAPVATNLSEETAALDAARTALRAGRATAAIALLEVCARRFPTGALQPEASALRVEALLAAGDRAGAEAVARALVTAAPSTLAAHRVTAMLNW